MFKPLAERGEGSPLSREHETVVSKGQKEREHASVDFAAAEKKWEFKREGERE